MRWLTDRWELKLIALGLAVALYFFTSNQITDVRSFTITIDKSNVVLPEGYIPSEVRPEKMDVRLQGPRSLLDALESDDIKAQLVVADTALHERRQNFDVTARLLGLPGSISLDSQPPPITVRFAPRVERSLPFDDRPEVIGIPEGLRYSLEFEITHVVVTGPEDVVDRLAEAGKLPVYPIELSGIDPDLAQTIRKRMPVMFKLDNPSVSIPDSRSVYVNVVVEPGRDEISTPPLPVRVLLLVDDLRTYDVALSPEVVVFKVSGPTNRLAKFKPAEQIRAFVDLSDPDEIEVPYEQAVSVEAPSWMSVKSQTVTVTVSLRQEEEETAEDQEGATAPVPTDEVEPPPVEPATDEEDVVPPPVEWP